MPEGPEDYAAYLERSRRDNAAFFLAHRTEDDAIVGFLNISEIIRGRLQSAFLGYGGVAGFAGQGYMCEALELVLREAFTDTRPASARGEHPTREPRVARARQAVRLRA